MESLQNVWPELTGRWPELTAELTADVVAAGPEGALGRVPAAVLNDFHTWSTKGSPCPALLGTKVEAVGSVGLGSAPLGLPVSMQLAGMGTRTVTHTGGQCPPGCSGLFAARLRDEGQA